MSGFGSKFVSKLLKRDGTVVSLGVMNTTDYASNQKKS